VHLAQKCLLLSDIVVDCGSRPEATFGAMASKEYQAEEHLWALEEFTQKQGTSLNLQDLKKSG